MCEKILCSTDDSIEVLGLNVRPRNALRRSGIDTIGELLNVVSRREDALFEVRNLGEKGVAEIQKRLSRVELLDPLPCAQENESQNEGSEQPQILVDLGPPTILRHVIVEWQQVMLARQIEARLLHPKLTVNGRTLVELQDSHRSSEGLYEQLLKVLLGPTTVSQELEHLLQRSRPRELDILVRRLGYKLQTLEEVASVMGITRERVRQLQVSGTRRLLSASRSQPLLRQRSAILYSNDLDLSFDEWNQRLLTSGLKGVWTSERIARFDQVELLIVVCRLLEDSDGAFEIPESLKYMIKLRGQGMSAVPARMFRLLESYSGQTERLVMRHLRYSGAVSLDWLANQDDTELSVDELRSVLEFKSFSKVGGDWFMSLDYTPQFLHYMAVFHRSLLKMFQYCGPLSLRDVCFGIERTLVKVDFPIPPLQVVKQILLKQGYACEGDLWSWPGESSEELNDGESAIWDKIHELGGVAHHSELMQAILDSGLSGASLHATLRRSPLFDKYDQALYKLRGTNPEHRDIGRARSAANTTRVNLSVERDTYGKIIVGANLGILAIASGTLMSESLPNLTGNWDCNWDDGCIIDVRVTRNEIRGLTRIIRDLGCEVGDRISLTFNVFNRTVEVRKTGDES